MWSQPAISSDLADDLNYFYTNKVQISRKNARKSVEIAIPIIQDILKYIRNNDPRFKAEMDCIGSYWQNLKIEKADEFDINVLLDIQDTFVWTKSEKEYYDVDPVSKKLVETSVPLPKPEPGYCRTGYRNPTDSKWKNSDLIFKGDLIPLLVKQQFKKLLKDAVRQLQMRGTAKVSRREHGPALTVYIEPVGHHGIDIDFAPVVPIHCSFQAWMGWPRQTARWPSASKIAKIKDIGVNETAKADLEWYISFAEAEMELIEGIDQDGGCRKKLLRIMKKLTHDVWCHETKPIPSSYMLKNILFWECERHPDSREWSNDKLDTRFTSMTRELLKCLRERRLGQYFYPAVNLLKDKDTDKIDRAVRNIETFLSLPHEYLRQE